jgi:cation diffusion facilitator CzcD-associated flavoprotein CzcO
MTDRFGLRRDIRFGARVTNARYDASANRWHVAPQACRKSLAELVDAHRARSAW